ncbi:hypothetical protein MUK42_27245 [Musa troglodytarum]|uniref:Uncharacterized protein n=1 Tax=Musa troglodytarum TaxID=320322 RepID=A0A9E7F542_9LILI|nr:hypothetical protein MUK42_27245 [Musa troglodytarum]
MVEIDAEHAGNVRPTVDVGTFSVPQIASLISMLIARLIIVKHLGMSSPKRTLWLRLMSLSSPSLCPNINLALISINCHNPT